VVSTFQTSTTISYARPTTGGFTFTGEISPCRGAVMMGSGFVGRLLGAFPVSCVPGYEGWGGKVLIRYSERIDVLVNVAGTMDNFSSADGVSDEEWDRVMAINLTAPVRMMRQVLPLMKARKDGVIVNVASTAATSGAVAGVAYTASKHGLLGATKNVAWRFRNEGIRCNAVLPGAIDSSIGKMIAAGWDAESFAQIE